jgi:hypothetical protein
VLRESIFQSHIVKMLNVIPLFYGRWLLFNRTAANFNINKCYPIRHYAGETTYIYNPTFGAKIVPSFVCRNRLMS